MYIQHNMMALGANRSLGINNRNKNNSMKKLSTGYKINQAADDAAGLAISEKLRSQIRGLNRAVNNVEDGISYIQTAEGALGEIQNMMHRIHELAVQAANDTNTKEDRAVLDEEVQHLKEEVDRTFRETEFNTIKIWDVKTNGRVQIGTEEKQAATMQDLSNRSFKVTEKNKGAIAYSSYKIEVQGTDETDASNYGFKVTWEGWNKKQYSTELISWDTVKSRKYSTNLADHIDTASYPELEGINFKFGWNAVETATISDIAASIDGVSFSGSESSSESITFNSKHSDISFQISTNYLAELASERNVDAYDTDWIQPATLGQPNVISSPSYTNVDEAKGWKIQFRMQNIGLVTATSKSISYCSNDRDTEDKGLWWDWVNENKPSRYKSGIWHTPDKGNGTLQGVTDCFKDSAGNGDSLSKDADSGGTIEIRFDITSNGQFDYEGRTSSSVGTITMNIRVGASDNEQTIMEKIKATLNDTTIVDAYEGNKSSGTPYQTTAYVYNASAKSHKIEVPVYKETIDRGIQAGANENQLIHLVYDTLRLDNLGIEESDVLTRENASRTITDIQRASEIVSGQRSLFGAYQNRLEHAELVDSNSSENLQSAESLIRDTDMAKEAMENAKGSILEQAGQAMLAQANRQTEGVLALLQ